MATVENNWDTQPESGSVFNIHESTVTIYGDLNVSETVSSDNTTIKS